jgi:hypothetical protein
VFRVGADLDINKALTWNIVTFRYRDAFNPDERYSCAVCLNNLTMKREAGHERRCRR